MTGRGETRPAVLALALTFFAAGCEIFTAPGPGADAAVASIDAAAQRACRAHADCDSGICDDFGVLAQPGVCVPAEMTAQVSTAAELQAALVRYPAVRLGPGRYTGDWTFSASRLLVGPAARDRARFQAPAVLQPAATGPVIHVVVGRLGLDGLTIQGGVGPNGHGALCELTATGLWLRRVQVSTNDGYGVWARCAAMIDRSLLGIAPGFTGNLAGAVRAEGPLRLTSSFVVGNGSAASAVSGVALQPLGALAPEQVLLAHLTLVYNYAAGQGPVVSCATAAPVTLWGSLLYSNPGAADAGAVSGSCALAAAASDSRGPLPAGSVRFTGDLKPGFSGSMDFHLQRSSPAVDAVPPGAPAQPWDIDGDPRPSGAAADYGADEVNE